MSDQPTRPDTHNWDALTSEQVLEALVYELYHPVSLLGSQLKRLTGDDDPLSEEDYEAIFERMDSAVRQLSKMVVQLKRYNAARRSEE